MASLRVLKNLFILAILSVTVIESRAYAQPLIEEERRLNFGLLAVSSNSAVSRFNVPRTGSNITIEGQFIMIDRGTTASFRFSGFPAFTDLSINIDNAVLIAGTSGIPESLSVDNFDFSALTTDVNGEAELSLGARLSTTGSGAGYVDAEFSGTTLLRVDYWQPDVGAFVSNSTTIEIDTELQSTLTIEEEQMMNFGTLFAQSDNSNQAVLSLRTNGAFSISEPGNSRLVSLTRPNNGVLKVSGAAPFNSLFITPQVSDVLLEHTERPESAPHFILSNLITTPNVSGTSDSNGELIIEIGGELKTELTTTPTHYPSGQYEGTYELTVTY